MSRLSLKPGIVYFLRYADLTLDRPSIFVKIGITEGDVQTRIEKLQTGNPYEIVEHYSFASEAAQLVERHVHGLWVERRFRGEWFRLTEEQLQQVVDHAKEFNEKLVGIASRVREYDRKPSIDSLIEPTDEIRRMHDEAAESSRQLILAKSRRDISHCKLQTLTGGTRGICGITSVSVTAPQHSFKIALLKSNWLNLYEQYLRVEELCCRFKMHDIPNVRAGVVLENLPSFDPDQPLAEPQERTLESMQIHSEYLTEHAKIAGIKGKLTLIELHLRDFCGLHAGINGVCNYVRETTKKFNASRFASDHPNIHSECFDISLPVRRFKVLESRSYSY